MTYEELLNYCCEMVRDSSTTAKSVIKGGINKGLTVLRKKLKRLYAIETRTFSYVNGQGTYQTPEDCIRPDRIVYIDGGSRDPLYYVDNDNEWDTLKQQINQTGRPEMWRMISSDIYEVWPRPTSNTATGEIRMQTRAKPLSQLDYIAGSVAVTQNSNAVVGTGTTWTTAMIGRFFRLADGNGHLSFYRIIGVADTTHLTLENNFAGVSGSTLSYKIGEVPNIPTDFHYALADHGMRNFWQWRKNPEMTKDAYADFLAVADSIEEDDQPTTSTVIESRKVRQEMTVDPFKRTPRAI